MSIIVAYLTLVGFAVGSFLALVADRLPRNESVVGARSHCEVCDRRLNWWELVPVLSYVGLRGRCYNCRTPIPFRLPAVEIGTGLLFALAGVLYGVTLTTATTLAFVSLLIAISLIDLDRKLILNKLVFPGAVVALAVAPWAPWSSGMPIDAWVSSLLGGAVGFGLLLVIYLISRGGMGAGDVKLAGLMGLMTGFPGIGAALFVGFVSGGLIGVLLLLLRLRGRRDVIPYGPYLSLGAVVALFYGEPLLEWYLGLLGLTL